MTSEGTSVWKKNALIFAQKTYPCCILLRTVTCSYFAEGQHAFIICPKKTYQRRVLIFITLLLFCGGSSKRCKNAQNCTFTHVAGNRNVVILKYRKVLKQNLRHYQMFKVPVFDFLSCVYRPSGLVGKFIRKK